MAATAAQIHKNLHEMPSYDDMRTYLSDRYSKAANPTERRILDNIRNVLDLAACVASEHLSEGEQDEAISEMYSILS